MALNARPATNLNFRSFRRTSILDIRFYSGEFDAFIRYSRVHSTLLQQTLIAPANAAPANIASENTDLEKRNYKNFI